MSDAKNKKKQKTEESAQPTEMATLGNLKPAPGSHRTRKRLGRGIGSGLGKTSGRGHKGQRARKSGNVRPGFEGGQMKLYMRLGKRGFTNAFAKGQNAVNVGRLSVFPAGSTVDAKALEAAGLIRDASLPVKLLGDGKLDRKLDIVVDRASAGARDAVEKAGGKLTIVPTH